jgi:uncharacterized protein (TIGR03437 family)
MKKTKNVMLIIISGLLMVTIATVSCSKSSTPATTAPVVDSISPSAADTIGEAITITGTSLSGASVTVGGFAATIVTVSATSITVTIPAGVAAGTAPVVVTTAGGATSPFNITIVGSSTAFKITTGPDAGDNSSNQIATANLIAYWPFDGSTNESLSSSGPTLTGGTITYVPGRIGEAANFANAWLTFPSSATGAGAATNLFNSSDTLQNGATISVWEQVPDTSQLTTLFQLSVPAVANWPEFGIQYRKHADSTFDLDGGLTNVDGTGTHPSYQYAFGLSGKDSGSWGFVTMVYDTTAGGRLIYYFDGAAVGTPVSVAPGSGSAQIFPAPEALLLVTPNYASIGTAEGNGYTPGDTTNPPASYMSYGITGNLDDIRFFNTSLSAQQVSDLYQLGLHGE